MKSNLIVVGIGELLWDILPDGRQLGGAPANCAYHAGQMGCESYIVSAIGNDELGDHISDEVQQLSIDTSFLQKSDENPTGTVSVEVDDSGSPSYIIHEAVAWDYINWNERLRQLASKTDAVCFGTLAQRNTDSRVAIQDFLKSTKDDCLVAFDVNLRQSFYNKKTITESLSLANILKLSDEELPVVSDFLSISGSTEQRLDQLIKMFNLKLVALTMGSEGSHLVTPSEKSYMAATKVKVADTIGAGDSFNASLVTGLLQKLDLRTIHRVASEVSAFVCSSKGATPILPKDLIDPFISSQ